MFYLSIWESLAEELRGRLTFTGNKATFNFVSLTGKEIKAHIKLLDEKMQDGESPVNPAQEMEKMREAFDRGIAIFVPATTKTGEAILANTTLSDLKQLSEDEKKERPFDIRVWKIEDGGSEGRLQALQILIKDNQVSLVVSANEDQQDWTVYMARTYAIAINDCAARKLFNWGDVQQGMDIQDRVAEVLQITFMEILDEQAIGGVYCSGDMAPDDDQGEEMSIDGPLTHARPCNHASSIYWTVYKFFASQSQRKYKYNNFLFPAKQKTAQFFPFLFCFTRELNLYTPLPSPSAHPSAHTLTYRPPIRPYLKPSPPTLKNPSIA